MVDTKLMAQQTQRETVLEMLMRFTPAAVALAVVFALSSSVTIGQKPTPIDGRSLAWSQRGTSALASKSYDQATDAFETALVLDPRNRAAFVGLAEVASAQGLPGKAIRFYDDAIRLDPSDVGALQAQGVAMVEKGAIASARGNLAKIKALCKSSCDAATRLGSAIGSGEGSRVVATSDLKPKPVGAPATE